MGKPAEILLFDFWDEQIKASDPDAVIYQLELHDTIYQTIKKPRGIRISDTVSTFSPYGDDEKEFDVFVEMVAFCKVAGKDKTARQPALTTAFEIQKEMYRILRANPSLGDRVCGTVLRRGGRSYDVYDGEPYAVASVPLIINPSGASYNLENS